MAIKSISHLNRFNNNDSYGTFSLSSPAMAFFDGNALTFEDKNFTDSLEGVTPPSRSTTTYWGSLFEISKPIVQSESLLDTTEYESQSITYQQLMENIIWDVKSYLNVRHNLSNYNFLSVIDGNYWFNGNKTFNNNLSVAGQLSVNNTLTCVGNAQFNTTLNVTGTATVNNATITNLTTNDSFTTNCNIGTDDGNKTFNGYAYGLTNRTDTVGSIEVAPTTCGTNSDAVGNPVMFSDGRPQELSCVNYATKAYHLTNSSGTNWNVGYGAYRTSDNKDDQRRDKQDAPTTGYSAVFFSNGMPYTTNVIDYAEKAYWADLGEKYLADDAYEPGTLVKFGGNKEITLADTEVNAIVSTKAFELNACLKDGIAIALCGRVPAKIKGKIEKFDKVMLSDTPGIACKWDGVSRVIGRALESNLDEDIKLVECVTRFEI